jgi:hypothetical protein
VEIILKAYVGSCPAHMQNTSDLPNTATRLHGASQIMSLPKGKEGSEAVFSKLKMRGAIPQLPQYAFMAWCLVKHRDNFTFTFYVKKLPKQQFLKHECPYSSFCLDTPFACKMSTTVSLFSF